MSKNVIILYIRVLERIKKIFMPKIINFIFNMKKKIDKNNFLEAIKQSFIVLFPVLFIGSLSLLLLSFPIEVVRNFIDTACNGVLKSILSLINTMTFGLSSLYLIIIISYKYFKLKSKRVNAIVFACINSLICYFLLIGPKVFLSSEPEPLLKYLNATNVFSVLLTSIISTQLYHVIIEKLIGIDRHKFSSSFSRSLISIIPIAICSAFYAICSVLIYEFTGTNFNDMLFYGLASIFNKIGPTYLGGLLITLFAQVFWMFGVHGTEVFRDVYLNVFNFEQGKIATKFFFDSYVSIGGCGTTLALAIALILFSKSRRKKKIGKLSTLTMAFNINETLIYGIPIIFNCTFMIPFIIVPIVNYSIAYLAVSSGLVAEIVTNTVQWTTPTIISGYIATESISGSILQIICILVGIGIYTPFVLMDNKVSDMLIEHNNEELTKLIVECEKELEEPHIFEKNNYLSSYAEDVLIHLEDKILNDSLTMYYQPLVMDDKIVSVEGLLRFKYRTNDFIYPPIIINIAKEKKMMGLLSKSVIETSIRDFKKMLEYNPSLTMSVNIDLELLFDDEFVDWFINKIETENIPGKQFGVEITENSKFYSMITESDSFKKIREKEINIYMDDFSMGHTAIAYLQNNVFDFVKLDGSLVKNIENERSTKIISSIINLGKTLNFGVVAEFVETEEQKKKLEDLGCFIYQGYLYYKPSSFNDIIKLIKENKNIKTK